MPTKRFRSQKPEIEFAIRDAADLLLAAQKLRHEAQQGLYSSPEDADADLKLSRVTAALHTVSATEDMLALAIKQLFDITQRVREREIQTWGQPLREGYLPQNYFRVYGSGNENIDEMPKDMNAAVTAGRSISLNAQRLGFCAVLLALAVLSYTNTSMGAALRAYGQFIFPSF